ncbi:sigma factor G inhibitor Gin [Cytobacillus gottheilii]|uniref:sigma factor G inhibitor Gin n=1 Tax=Cytobacillus gottheilii TaxID=859144 RepID=UPI0027D457B2|nr:sigma factor G inhibitor Gin [Cytobacillus gottheilii]
MICDQAKVRGIHLYTSFICTECERELISTDTSHPKYNHYLSKLKKVTTPQILS